jgi:hypothetical protein
VLAVGEDLLGSVADDAVEVDISSSRAKLVPKKRSLTSVESEVVTGDLSFDVPESSVANGSPRSAEEEFQAALVRGCPIDKPDRHVEAGTDDSDVFCMGAVVGCPWLVDAITDVCFIAHTLNIIEMDRSGYLAEAVQHRVAFACKSETGAGDLSIWNIEEVIANGSPHTLVLDLQSTLVGLYASNNSDGVASCSCA